MFGIGSMELVVIFIVALLVLGPKNLPKIAHTLGRALGEFRRVSTEFQRSLNTEIAFEEEKEKNARRKAKETEKLTEENTSPAESSFKEESEIPQDNYTQVNSPEDKSGLTNNPTEVSKNV